MNASYVGCENIQDSNAGFKCFNNKLSGYLADEYRYPEAARSLGIEGKIYVNFVVESDGSISNVKVVKGFDALLDAEAVRSVSSTPSASLAARAYLAASELAQELVAARLDQKAPAGAETAAALAAAMAAGARAVVLGDVPASETLAGVVDGLKDASREKEESSTLGSVLDATRAFASVFASDKAALRNDVAAALRGFAAGEKENERGLGRDAR